MVRVDSGRLEQVGRAFGHAALDPSAWPGIMEGVCRAAGATGAVLLQGDVRTPDVPMTAGVAALVGNYFRDGWHTAARDLRVRGVPLLLSGEAVVTDQDLVKPEEIEREAYYNECLRPFGFRWFAGIGFLAESALWVLCLQRTIREGPFEPEDKRVLAALSPALTEAATVSAAIGRSVVSGVANALGALAQGALVLDRSGHVIDGNAAAERIFDDDIRVAHRRLILRDPKARTGLDALIDRLRTVPDAPGPPTATVAVRRVGKAPALIRVLPVPPAARTPFLGARAVLTLTDLGDRPRPQATILSAAFGLTPAEARLAALVATGASPEQAAAELQLSRDTVRNQLKAVFAKTDTHRQAELVALLSRL